MGFHVTPPCRKPATDPVSLPSPAPSPSPPSPARVPLGAGRSAPLSRRGAAALPASRGRVPRLNEDLVDLCGRAKDVWWDVSRLRGSTTSARGRTATCGGCDRAHTTVSATSSGSSQTLRSLDGCA